MSSQIPLVDYINLRGKPHLTANECINCGARFFGRRNAYANCFGTEFNTVDVETDGEVLAFSIVAFAAPGIDVPFVLEAINCGGTSVNANIINTPADPKNISLGKKVTLATYSMGRDDHGIEAIGFGFEPAA